MSKYQKYDRTFQQEQNTTRVRFNDYIRIPNVMLINQNNENLGVISTDEAKRLAKVANLDLVEVSPNSKPPVCRIMDYNKFKYEQLIKEKEKKKKQKQNVVPEKEIRLRPSTGDNDLLTKINAAKKFLEDGCRVRIHLQYKRRENAHKDLGFPIIQKFIQDLSEVGSPQKPRLEGSDLNCIIEPKKNNE